MASSLWNRKGEASTVYAGLQWNYQSYQRIGIFQNGGFPQQSLGEREALRFSTLSAKLGGSISLSSKHNVSLHLGYLSQPPRLRSIYPNPRESHTVIPDLTSEKSYVTELNYQ